MRSGLDFSSALYLGWRHSAASLGGWDSLSLGKPAALQNLAGSRSLAAGLAQLQGCASASLYASMLHLVWDVFSILPQAKRMIFFDQACYPVLKWGVERAQAQGVPARAFAAHQLPQLRDHLAQAAAQARQPIIVSEGYRPGFGQMAPLAEYAALAKEYGGYLFFDDTQALGIFGHGAGAGHAWGQGGAGSLRALNLSGPHIIVAASLAKAFGAPLAVLAADATLIADIERESQTRLHTSPPNQASVRAGQIALQANPSIGEQRRQKLWRNLQYWWQGLFALGLRSQGGPFPVQSLIFASTQQSLALHAYLQEQGVSSVLQRARHRGNGQLSFIFTAEHSLQDIDRLLALLARWHKLPSSNNCWQSRIPGHYSAHAYVPTNKNFVEAI